MKRAVVLALVALSAAGCASVTPPLSEPTSTPIEPPAGRIVFQVEAGGGMEPLATAIGRRPALTVYGDGRAFTIMESRTFTGAPVGLAQETVAGPALRRLMGRALLSGLFGDAEPDFGDPHVTDVGGTTLTFRPDFGAARRASAYALEYRDGDGDLTETQRHNRQALRDLIKDLFDAVPSADVGEYLPEQVDVTELPVSVDESPVTSTRWPGPSLTGLLARTHGRNPCGVLAGAPARRLYLAARHNAHIDWTVDGTHRRLIVRALLPGEQGCRGY